MLIGWLLDRQAATLLQQARKADATRCSWILCLWISRTRSRPDWIGYMNPEQLDSKLLESNPSLRKAANGRRWVGRYTSTSNLADAV